MIKITEEELMSLIINETSKDTLSKSLKGYDNSTIELIVIVSQIIGERIGKRLIEGFDN